MAKKTAVQNGSHNFVIGLIRFALWPRGSLQTHNHWMYRDVLSAPSLRRRCTTSNQARYTRFGPHTLVFESVSPRLFLSLSLPLSFVLGPLDW